MNSSEIINCKKMFLWKQLICFNFVLTIVIKTFKMKKKTFVHFREIQLMPPPVAAGNKTTKQLMVLTFNCYARALPICHKINWMGRRRMLKL